MEIQIRIIFLNCVPQNTMIFDALSIGFFYLKKTINEMPQIFWLLGFIDKNKSNYISVIMWGCTILPQNVKSMFLIFFELNKMLILPFDVILQLQALRLDMFLLMKSPGAERSVVFSSIEFFFILKNLLIWF